MLYNHVTFSSPSVFELTILLAKGDRFDDTRSPEIHYRAAQSFLAVLEATGKDPIIFMNPKAD